MKTSQLVLFVGLVIAFIAAIYLLYFRPGENGINNVQAPTTTDNVDVSTTTAGGQTLTVKLYLRDEFQYQTDCGAVREVQREIPRTSRVADATLRLLFQEELKELIPSYRGVSISEGVALVDFASSSLSYLNSAACMQQSFKAPIEETLKQFSTVEEVQYSINGRVFDQWDA